jgi:DNA-binding NtrC family response regulator/tetratricopeptide (TPR) repeat protein
MQRLQRAINRLIEQSTSHQRHGEYGRGYRCIKRILTLDAANGVSRDTWHRVLLEAARCAYYLTLFDEAEQHLDQLDASLACHGSGTAEVRCAEAIIRANIHRRRGDYEKALSVLKTGFDGCDDVMPSMLVERLLIEGSCRFYRNEIQDAEEKLEAALGLATHHADPRLRARILTMMGFLARGKGQLHRAQDCLIRAKDICRATSDRYGEAAACLNLGIVRYQCGRFIEAERSISRAHSIFEKIGWRLGVCRSLLGLGNVKRYRRDFRRAAVLYDKARTLAERESFIREESLVHEFIGDLHRERGDLDEAERCYRASLDIAGRAAPEGDVMVEVYRRLGELCMCKGAHEESRELLERGLTLARRLNERTEKGLILRAMGRCMHALGEVTSGREQFEKAIALLALTGGGFELALTHLQYAESLLAVTADEEVDDAGVAADGKAGCEQAWRHLIEAGHLLQGMDAPYWQMRVDRLLEKTAARRRLFHASRTSCSGDTNLVTIRLSPEFVIADTLAGVSDALTNVWEQVTLAARAPWPVLITGETGTGKELVARLIHVLSDRRDRPFIAMNCAAIPDHLFESELFGHRRGCFTGALTDRRGILEEANGGSLFLDEIGELTPLQQAKLLRVLQESRIRRVGENIERRIDIRIVSATNQDLERKIEHTNFRKDFYYRINAEQIHIPALRDRPEDIVPLLAFFFCGSDNGKPSHVKIESAALKSLQLYSWPGNVRELLSVLARVRHISEGNVITLDALPGRITSCRVDNVRTFCNPNHIDGADGAMLRRALSICKGNKTAAAQWLGISRGTLYKALRRRGMGHLIRQRCHL